MEHINWLIGDANRSADIMKGMAVTTETVRCNADEAKAREKELLAALACAEAHAFAPQPGGLARDASNRENKRLPDDCIPSAGQTHNMWPGR